MAASVFQYASFAVPMTFTTCFDVIPSYFVLFRINTYTVNISVMWLATGHHMSSVSHIF